MLDINTANSTPFSSRSSSFNGGDMVTEVASQPGSRPASPEPSATTNSPSVMTADGHSMASVNSSAGPEAQITFDIRARSVEQKSSHQQVIQFQKAVGSHLEGAGKAWKAEPRYNFTQRATLYKAYVQAQIRFNKFSSLSRLEQAHASYLDALSRSTLPPDEQHKKYSEFKEAINTAHTNYRTASSGEELSINCPSKYTEATNAARKTAAADSEKHVRNLLKDIQQPHTELRNNIAANLHYRDVQLRNPAKTEDERATLKSDISVIRSFQATGGLDSLTQPESTELNALFKDATTKYNAWKKEPSEASRKFTPDDDINENGIEITDFNKPPSQKQIHEQAFKAADAAVITKIRELSVNLKVPPQLRKDLTAHLKHKEALQTSATGDEATKLNEEITTLKAFLSSRELAALDLKTAAPLTTFFREADKQYANWKNLETAAKATEEAAQKVSAEPLAPDPKEEVVQAKTAETATLKGADALPAPAPTASLKEDPKAPTKEEEAQAKAKQVKMEAQKVLGDKANQARQAADAARTSSEEADIEVMHAVRELGPPVTFYATEDVRAVSSALPPISVTTAPGAEAAIFLAKDESIEGRATVALSASSTAAAVTTSTTAAVSDSVSTENSRSLWKFTEKLQARENSHFTKTQLASLQKFLSLDEVAVAAIPPEKLKNLVDRMNEIEEKNKKFDVVSEANATTILEQEITALETQFIEALET